MLGDAPTVVLPDTFFLGHVPLVGGKKLSFGETICTFAAKGVRVPPGFATTSDVYWLFLNTFHFRHAG